MSLSSYQPCLPLPTDGTPWACVINSRSLSCPRLALSENPLPEVNLTLHVDGSHLRKEDGALQAGYAITDHHELLEYRALPNVKLAHVTAFVALPRACIKAEGWLTFMLTFAVPSGRSTT